MGIKIEQVKKEKIGKPEISLDNFLKKEITLFGKSFSNKKKEHFYTELSVLLRSGITLKQALDIILESQSANKDMELIKKINEDILRGNSFAETLKKDGSFTPYEFHAIQIGEQTGKLPQVTSDLGNYYRRRNEQKREIISSLTYPVIVLVSAFIVVLFMLNYVVPMFEDIFKQNQVNLPFLTQLIVYASHVLENYGFLIFLFFALVLVLIKLLKNKIWFKKYYGSFLLRLPILGKYTKKIYLVRFTQSMMLLTNSRIPVLNGLGMVREMINFFPLQKSLEDIEDNILQGEKMSTSFGKHSFFSKKFVALLKIAEETNQTEFIFQKLYDQYSRETEQEAKTITNILNPLLTLMVGFIVGVILIAMYLPMFKLSSVIG